MNVTTPDFPQVSICLLTWNRCNVLSRSLDALLAQSFVNFELIINDDNSTDETEAVARRYEAIDARVRYYKNSTNLMYSGNSNAAVARARGEFVMFAHDGDYYDEKLVETWVNTLVKHPTAAIAFCALRSIAEYGVEAREYLSPYPEFIKGDWLLDDMTNRFDSPIFGIAMVRKAYLLGTGLFDDRFPRLTDVDMWMRLLAKYDAVYVNKPLISIMPREGGHENRGVNWGIHRQLESIRLTNIKRAFKNNPEKMEQKLARLREDRRKLVGRSLLSCLKHGHIKRFAEGLKHLAAAPVDVEETSRVQVS